MINRLGGQVGVFYSVGHKLLIHTCDLKDAAISGQFLVYPYEHRSLWQRHYQKKYRVDFDYFPRGRIAYCTTDGTYTVFYDPCCIHAARDIRDMFGNETVTLQPDSRYTCYRCSIDYAMLDEKNNPSAGK
ncbi:MAG: hypothetical protein Q4C54_04830 [Clostridia bacterium]|nr:hypothetical protein [Clostridia bacterium]